MAETKLIRSHGDRKIAGVCAGLARRYSWDLERVRLVFVVAGCLGIGLIAYFFLWVFLPGEEHPGSYYSNEGSGEPSEQVTEMEEAKLVARGIRSSWIRPFQS
jgi:phage shock protein C